MASPLLDQRPGPLNTVGPLANSSPRDPSAGPTLPTGAASTPDPNNAPAPKPAAPAQTPEQKRQRAVYVRELFFHAREARRRIMSQWKTNYKALNNKEYRAGDNAWDEEPKVSSVWPVVASAVAWMTDQRPITEVSPVIEPYSPYWEYYYKLAKDMNTCLASVHSNYGLDGEITKILWDTYTYGIGYTKTQWEAHLADGIGDVTYRRVDPFTLYPDPHAHDMDECSYIIEARTMTVKDVDRAWPGAAQLIAQATPTDELPSAPHRGDTHLDPNQPRAALGALAPSTSPQSHTRSQNPNRDPDEPVVTILEAYIRDHTTTEVADGVAQVSDEWRCVVVCGDQILMDTPCSEMSAFPTHPYDRCVLFDTGEWYGPCIVELLTPIQRVINWLLGAIARNIYLMGNPVLVESMRNASRNKRFSNRPGARLEGDPESIKWLNPPQMHPQLSMQLVEYYESKIETISGLSAMVRGFSPTGRNAQGVLDSVQDAAFVRVRASLRELERTLRGVATKQAATIAEFYSEPRLMSLIGTDGQQTHLNLRARHFYSIDNEHPEKRVPLRFTLNADAGSQLPTSKQARAAEAKHLFTLGAIDVFELLKATEWPNYALVAQRVMQQQAMSAQAEASKKGQ